jgi:hypothetical protein
LARDAGVAQRCVQRLQQTRRQAGRAASAPGPGLLQIIVIMIMTASYAKAGVVMKQRQQYNSTAALPPFCQFFACQFFASPIIPEPIDLLTW